MSRRRLEVGLVLTQEDVDLIFKDRRYARNVRRDRNRLRDRVNELELEVLNLERELDEVEEELDEALGLAPRTEDDR